MAQCSRIRAKARMDIKITAEPVFFLSPLVSTPPQSLLLPGLARMYGGMLPRFKFGKSRKIITEP